MAMLEELPGDADATAAARVVTTAGKRAPLALPFRYGLDRVDQGPNKRDTAVV
jgi:hypothetical protein